MTLKLKPGKLITKLVTIRKEKIEYGIQKYGDKQEIDVIKRGKNHVNKYRFGCMVITAGATVLGK